FKWTLEELQKKLCVTDKLIVYLKENRNKVELVEQLTNSFVNKNYSSQSSL
ncbi:hypothetical protein RUM43_003006, partial [Polyplax serrata]